MRALVRAKTNQGTWMSIGKRHLAEQEDVLVLTERICIAKGALVYDIDSDEVFFSADEEAYKTAYVTMFKAWAKGTIKGTAEQVFLMPQNQFLKTSLDRKE
jgi:hypothetical protein